MILLFNVFLTKSSANPYLNLQRGNLKESSKIEITKYSLASLFSAYKWKRAIINIELDEDYKYAENDIHEFVHNLFKDVDLKFSNKRNLYQEDWINTYKDINDDFILYLGNHDHIFIDSSTQYFEDLIEEVKNKKYQNPTIAISHWPESIRCCKSGYIELNELIPRSLNKNYKIEDKYITYNSTCIDSLIIITKSLYKEWFLNGVWDKDVKLPRTEGTGNYTLLNIKQYLGQELPIQTMITPYKELFRHFDGYMHQRISNNVCPSLEIPDGFFESKIKIRYGYEDRKDSWVNLNPKSENYFAFDISGADYKFTIEDIPIFWKDRISEIDINKNLDEEEMIQYTLFSTLKSLYSDDRYSPYIDNEVEEKILSTLILNYKDYKIIN